MHASLPELLSLRDEVVADGAVLAHVRECAECHSELNRLRSVTVQLRGLSTPWAAPDRWDAVEHRLRQNTIEGFAAVDDLPAAAELTPGLIKNSPMKLFTHASPSTYESRKRWVPSSHTAPAGNVAKHVPRKRPGWM